MLHSWKTVQKASPDNAYFISGNVKTRQQRRQICLYNEGLKRARKRHPWQVMKNTMIFQNVVHLLVNAVSYLLFATKCHQ